MIDFVSFLGTRGHKVERSEDLTAFAKTNNTDIKMTKDTGNDK